MGRQRLQRKRGELALMWVHVDRLGGWQSGGQGLNGRDPDRAGEGWRVRRLPGERGREVAEKGPVGRGDLGSLTCVGSGIQPSRLWSGLPDLRLPIQSLHTSGDMPAFSSALSSQWG